MGWEQDPVDPTGPATPWEAHGEFGCLRWENSRPVSLDAYCDLKNVKKKKHKEGNGVFWTVATRVTYPMPRVLEDINTIELLRNSPSDGCKALSQSRSDPSVRSWNGWDLGTGDGDPDSNAGGGEGGSKGDESTSACYLSDG
jgi:hypothetical protein